MAKHKDSKRVGLTFWQCVLVAIVILAFAIYVATAPEGGTMFGNPFVNPYGPARPSAPVN